MPVVVEAGSKLARPSVPSQQGLLFGSITESELDCLPQISLLHTMIPTGASAAVLKPSDPVARDAVSVQGPDFDQKHTFQEFMSSYERIGFQANSLGKAIDIVDKMVRTTSNTFQDTSLTIP